MFIKSIQRRQWQPTPVLLLGKSHGWRSLIGCSPWGCEESDMTERLHFHFSLSCIGEGNGNPLQYSCLENPRDRGAWWAAVSGVVESRTWLKRLSSSLIIKPNRLFLARAIRRTKPVSSRIFVSFLVHILFVLAADSVSHFLEFCPCACELKFYNVQKDWKRALFD